MVPGIFMKTFDWEHPDFAPWKLERSDLNKAQRDALLSEHIDVSKNKIRINFIVYRL